MQKIEFYKSLEKLYKKACRQKRIEIALRIRQLQAKMMGFLVLKERKIPKLSELTDAEIETFLQECEQIS
ncbi:MAG: hypothetical protein K2Q34_04600 [Alphaproteobacteria bacterium]|nr:hypothetical protein [Alphaproteobacteria bacterium]